MRAWRSTAARGRSARPRRAPCRARSARPDRVAEWRYGLGTMPSVAASCLRDVCWRASICARDRRHLRRTVLARAGRMRGPERLGARRMRIIRVPRSGDGRRRCGRRLRAGRPRTGGIDMLVVDGAVCSRPVVCRMSGQRVERDQRGRQRRVPARPPHPAADRLSRAGRTGADASGRRPPVRVSRTSPARSPSSGRATGSRS